MRIRNLRIGAITAAVAILIGLGGASPALADTRDDVVTADSSLEDAVNAYLKVVNDSTTSSDDVDAAGQTFIAAATTAQGEFSSVAATDSDATIKGYASDFATDAGKLIADVQAVSKALASQDETAFDQASTDFNSTIDAYQSTGDAYNQYLEDNPIASGDPMYAFWLVLLIVAAVVFVAVALLVIATRGRNGALPAKTQRNGAVRQTTLLGLRRGLLVYAGLFLVGAAVPFIQYWWMEHHGGDHYYIFWYALGAGGVLTVVFLIRYFLAMAKVRREGSAPLVGAEAAAASTATPPTDGAPAAPADPYAPIITATPAESNAIPAVPSAQPAPPSTSATPTSQPPSAG